MKLVLVPDRGILQTYRAKVDPQLTPEGFREQG